MAESILATSSPGLLPATLPDTPALVAPPGRYVNEARNLVKTQVTRKRRRSSKPHSPAVSDRTGSPPASDPHKTFQLAPNEAKKTTRLPDFIPAPLTGVAALVDEQRAREEQASIEARQTSPNPARKALGDLLLGSHSGGMSKLSNASSAATEQNGSIAEGTRSIKVPFIPENEDKMETSPKSAASLVTQGSSPVATITPNGASVASPRQLDDTGVDDETPASQNNGTPGANDADLDEGRSSKAFTYPGPMLNAQAHRTASLPQTGYGRDSTRSPSTKRHKCPYCSTDFTRHHNLKSHLLTHSHEKPYSCDACDSRFRRLHDLKRHTKLHTGERPHVCPKCDRSFARGDALARHNKGQGGCAGRRSSMGSFGGDEKHEDRLRSGEGESMPGIMYTGEASHEPENMDEDTGGLGGRSLPSIRKHEAPNDTDHRQASEHTSTYQARQPSTYPPVATRQPTTGGLYPPPNTSPRGGSGTSTVQSSLNQSSYPGSSIFSPFQAPPGPNVFAQGGMTESPKPLSPGGAASHQLGHADTSIHRNRSPSLTQQFQQQHFGRRTASHHSPPMSLPPPHTGAHTNAPLLPSLSGLNPPDLRFTLQSQASGSAHLHSVGSNGISGPSHGPNSPNYPPGHTSSPNNSLSSHSTGPHTSLDRTHNTYPPMNDPLWAHVKSLEAKIDRLQEEVMSLRNNLGGQHR